MQTLEEALKLPEITQKVTTTPGKLRRQERKEKTIDLMLNTDLTPTNIAKQMGIARKTVYVYWHEWQETEEAAQINRKWHRLCKALEEENMEKAFDGLTKVKVRMTTEKKEIDKSVTLTKNVNVNVKSMLAEYECLFTENRTEKETVPSNNPAEPLHTPEPHANQKTSISINP